MLRILTDRGTEYCGKVETHDYQLYLAVNDIQMCCGRTPMETLEDGIKFWQDKNLNQI